MFNLTISEEGLFEISDAYQTKPVLLGTGNQEW